MTFIQLSALFDYLDSGTKKRKIKWRHREDRMYETIKHEPLIVIMRSFDRSQICIAMRPFEKLGIDGNPKFFQQGSFFWTDAQKLFILIENQLKDNHE